MTEIKYMTASQAAKKWNISQRRVQILCSQDRIDGVFKLGKSWVIPISTNKPIDSRRKNIKQYNNDIGYVTYNKQKIVVYRFVRIEK